MKLKAILKLGFTTIILLSCSANIANIKSYTDKIENNSFTKLDYKKLNEMSWTKTYFRVPYEYRFINPIYKKNKSKLFYIIDTIHINNYIIIKYENKEFIGSKETLLSGIERSGNCITDKAHINNEILFGKDVYICATGLLSFGYNDLFPDKDGKYKNGDNSMYAWDYDMDKTKKIAKNLTIYKFYKEPKYYLLGLIEWGTYARMELGEFCWSYDFYKEQMSRLGGYCKVVVPMYDK